jgi:uncharacterized protein (DUF433 family)
MKPIEIIDRGRGPELAHIRITVFDLLPYVRAGWHPTSMAALFDLSMIEIDALLHYIEDHESEVRAEDEKITNRIAIGNSPDVEAKRRVSRMKLLALRDRLERNGGPEDPHARASG